MLAASYWSLLAPAVGECLFYEFRRIKIIYRMYCVSELTKTSTFWGGNALFEVIPVTFGFLMGALFVYVADGILDSMGVTSPAVALG